ncbi:MAG: YicC/YloC family endoribonuclease [Candidatus Omnitrophota bacterium]
MIHSMTGFGKGEAKGQLGNAKAEIKTINHRFFEFSFRVPEVFLAFEEKIKYAIQGKIRRGRVNLVLSFDRNVKPEDEIFVDEKLARKYKTLLMDLKKGLNLAGDIKLEQILSFPSVITTKPKQDNAPQLWATTKKALDRAIAETLRSREKEGRALYKDLSNNAGVIESALIRIKKRLPSVVQKYRTKLLKTLNKPGVNPALLERVEEEAAVFARNCDVSEEITRMYSHIKTFKAALSGREVGRKLDFIAQELQREANTVGSKASDFQMQKEVIKIKGAIEKIREQVQNIE